MFKFSGGTGNCVTSGIELIGVLVSEAEGCKDATAGEADGCKDAAGG